jgi:hypothetical protein
MMTAGCADHLSCGRGRHVLKSTTSTIAANARAGIAIALPVANDAYRCAQQMPDAIAT